MGEDDYLDDSLLSISSKGLKSTFLENDENDILDTVNQELEEITYNFINNILIF